MSYFTNLNNIAKPKHERSKMISSLDPSGGNRDFISIDPRKTATLSILDKPSNINRIWVTLRSIDPMILRKAVLRFSWDNEKSPSVEVPFGDFFGCGFGEYRHHTSMMQEWLADDSTLAGQRHTSPVNLSLLI